MNIGLFQNLGAKRPRNGAKGPWWAFCPTTLGVLPQVWGKTPTKAPNIFSTVIQYREHLKLQVTLGLKDIHMGF